MKMPNLFALSAAVMITASSLSAVLADQPYHRTTEINGIEVVDLPTVTVSPSAQDRRSAALLSSATLGSTSAVAIDGDANVIGSQLAMPYYSFGSKFGRVSKE